MNTQHPKQLPIPPKAAADEKAIELLRVWASGGKQHVTLATKLWAEPANWGLMLVDLAKHIANAYEQTEGRDRSQVLARIHEGFEAEWTAPTDTPSGGPML